MELLDNSQSDVKSQGFKQMSFLIGQQKNMDVILEER